MIDQDGLLRGFLEPVEGEIKRLKDELTMMTTDRDKEARWAKQYHDTAAQLEIERDALKGEHADSLRRETMAVESQRELESELNEWKREYDLLQIRAINAIKEVERLNALETERADFLLRVIGNRSLEHFAVRWKELVAENEQLTGLYDGAKTAVDAEWKEIERLRAALEYHVNLHKNFPAHGSARMMEMERQLSLRRQLGIPIEREALPECDCDGCMKARKALEVKE
jgi:chromosome segregation ATPase